MAKVQALSNAVNKSVKHADVVEEVVGITFLNPTCTRWSSEFAAVGRIASVGSEKVRECQQKIGLAPMTEANMSFLKGLVHVMKPLQSPRNFFKVKRMLCWATIMGIQNKLRSMGIDESMTPLRQAILTGLQTWFRAVFADDQYHIASVLIPRFKLNDLPAHEQHLKKLLLAQATLALDKCTTVTSIITYSDDQSILEAASASDYKPKNASVVFEERLSPRLADKTEMLSVYGRVTDKSIFLQQ